MFSNSAVTAVADKRCQSLRGSLDGINQSGRGHAARGLNINIAESISGSVLTPNAAAKGSQASDQPTSRPAPLPSTPLPNDLK